MLFLNHRKRCIQVFNAGWLEIEMKYIRCENHDYSDFSNQQFFGCIKSRTSSIFTQVRNLCCKAYEKMLIISKNFDAKKKTRVKNSGFKVCGTDSACEMNSSRIQIKQVRNIRSIISWDQQFRHINRISATTTNASILAHMRQLMCTLHLAERVYNKFSER